MCPVCRFPFLFGGTFIEGRLMGCLRGSGSDFPSFSEGLSLREVTSNRVTWLALIFPFLFGGTFIEGPYRRHTPCQSAQFPFLFGGTFIEGFIASSSRGSGSYFPSFSEGLSLRVGALPRLRIDSWNFPSFSEGLSLRVVSQWGFDSRHGISLPFRRDFH